ncbi:DUF2178 domain-containing protein [Halobaculum lipolyticum]|uniref:DUF2178 domain-containing protein n=1 Tax=Halobaculum lipolyticum TaxID=3032001 RepID=A0ABD5WCF8_9EURY|nr:DUF2178 domain-containing protein [Halobaculum sp. DT31]
MTETVAAPTVARRRRYKRLLYGSVAVAVVANVALRLLSYPVAAEATYLLGILAFVAVWRLSPVTLFDERDEELERRASTITLSVAAVVLIVGASGARALSALGVYEAPPVVAGVLYGYVGLFVVFALALAWVKFTR